MLFLTSELANEAEITTLSARDTTRAWVPGRCIMGREVGVYKTWYNTWLSSRLQNQPRSFRFVSFIFSLLSSFFFRYHASSLVGSVVLISFFHFCGKFFLASVQTAFVLLAVAQLFQVFVRFLVLLFVL